MPSPCARITTPSCFLVVGHFPSFSSAFFPFSLPPSPSLPLPLSLPLFISPHKCNVYSRRRQRAALRYDCTADVTGEVSVIATRAVTSARCICNSGHRSGDLFIAATAATYSRARTTNGRLSATRPSRENNPGNATDRRTSLRITRAITASRPAFYHERRVCARARIESLWSADPPPSLNKF